MTWMLRRVTHGSGLSLGLLRLGLVERCRGHGASELCDNPSATDEKESPPLLGLTAFSPPSSFFTLSFVF